MPSSSRRDELSRLLRRLPLAVVAAMAVWLMLRPLYDPVICAAAQAVARFYEYPRVAQIDAIDGAAVIGRSDLRSGSARLKLPLTQVTFNLIPFLALVLATPRALARGGWRKLLLGVAILAGIHAVGLVLQLKFFYAFSLGEWSRANYSDAAREVYGGLRYFFEIPVTFATPLLLWVGLFSERVFAVVGFAPATGGQAESDSATGSRSKASRR